jgi:hypothetical protein
VNGHSEHGSDDTSGKGGAKKKTTVSKANVEHPGNEDDLKNSDKGDPISQKSHSSDGELLQFYIYREMPIYIPCTNEVPYYQCMHIHHLNC